MDESWRTATTWSAISHPLTLSREVVHLVRLRFELPAPDFASLREHLSEDEQERADRFRFDEPRSRFVCCRAALRLLIGRCCNVPPAEIQFCYGLHGKPVLANSNPSELVSVQFNVSHSGDLGLIALTREMPVGVDVEECSPTVKIMQLAERFFSVDEARELAQLSGERQTAGFYRGWTCKEAYMKITGRGFSLPLSSFSVVIDPDRPAALKSVVDHPDEPARWSLRAVDVGPGYAAAVMMANPAGRIETWDWAFD